MKNLIFAAIIIMMSACSSEKLDMTASIETSTAAVKYIGNKEFSNLFVLYAKDFAASEPQDLRRKEIRENY